MRTTLQLEDTPLDLTADILLVDDQPANLLALRAALEQLGHNLVEADSGEEALRRLTETDYAVILLNVQMHGLDGFETARQIRRRESCRHTPIIFITALESERSLVEQAYALGAVDYLVRPLVPIVLRAKVAGFVELFRKTEQVRQQAEQIRQMERREFEHRLSEERARLRQSEQVLAQSEERFRQLAESINEVFWMADPQTTEVLYISPAYERVWGRSCQSLYEEPRSFLDAVHPDDRDRVRVAALEKHGRGESTDEEYRVVRPDGSVRWIRDRAFPVRDATGQVYRMAGIAEDITEKKHAEEALQQANQRKDEFLAMLAHELRNPLAPVWNALQIMKMPGVNAEVVSEAREMMERQVQHLTRLVDDLLDVSRIMRNRIELRKERVDLATVFARALETAQPLIAGQQHQLSVSLPATPVVLECDPVRMAQVVGNLLLNAAKYTDQAGSISLTAERVDGEVVICVRDTGVGIDPELLPHVFDLFTQADRSLARSQGGLGIGLTVVKHLVEMHGGSVHAGSAGASQGSEFVIRLPALPPQPRGDDAWPTGVEVQPRGSPRRVLVVDDNVDAVQSTAILLRMLGHKVETAHDGHSALETVQTFQPEVILLDIGLPGISGYDVARALRAKPENRPLILVAVTGYGQDEDCRRSAEAGFDRHLVKPVNPVTLAGLLASL
jgi:PAS domain S-box-containing protein